jgi:phage terminase large subunit-like protein
MPRFEGSVFHICEKYAEEVLDGTIPSGNLLKLAAKRWKKDVNDRKFTFNETKAVEVVTFITKKCVHWEGPLAGKNIELEPWQIFYFGNLFGWYRQDGYRRFRTSYLQVARKNGKTFMAACMGLYMISPEEGENAPQVLVAANKEEQAGLCVNSAGRIADESKGFRVDDKHNFTDRSDRDEITLHHLRERIIKVVNNESRGVLMTLGRDSARLDGYNPSGSIVDEYHEARSSGLFDVLRSGMGARPNPMINVITTAGFNKAGVCYHMREQYIRILEGSVENDSTFPLIYEMDAEDDWTSPDTWQKCNPNMGVSVFVPWLEQECMDAKNQGGTAEVSFKTKNLNVWTDSASVWVPDADVLAANHYPFTLEDLIGRRIWAGIDLGKTRDINALCLLCPNEETNKFDLFWRFYLPEERAKQNNDGVDYIRWEQDGWLQLTPGNIIDHDYIVKDVEKLLELGLQIQSIGYDKYLAESHNTVHGILNLGYDSMRPVGQTPAYLSTPTKEVEVMMLHRRMNFYNPMVRWMFANVIIKADSNGNIKPDKAQSGNKIDGVSALVNAMHQFLLDQHEGEIIIDNEIYSF